MVAPIVEICTVQQKHQELVYIHKLVQPINAQPGFANEEEREAHFKDLRLRPSRLAEGLEKVLVGR